MDNKLTKLYTRMLESTSCTIEEDGTVLAPYSDKPITLRVNGRDKTLIIPTKDNQANADPKTTVFFDPASESLIKGNSEVFNRLNEIMVIKLTMTADLITYAMITLALDKKALSGSRIALKRMFDGLPPVSKTTLDTYGKIQRKARGGKKPLPTVTMSVMRTRSIDDVKYARVCKFDVPLLKSPSGKLAGSKVSGNAEKTIRSLYEKLIPPTTMIGSNSKTTPNLDALVGMYYEVATHFNGIINTLGKHAGDAAPIDISWSDEYDNLAKYSKQYLPMPSEGNVGTDVKGDVSTGAAQNDVEPSVPTTAPRVKSTTEPKRSVEKSEPQVESVKGIKPMPMGLQPIGQKLSRNTPERVVTPARHVAPDPASYAADPGDYVQREDIPDYSGNMPSGHMDMRPEPRGRGPVPRGRMPNVVYDRDGYEIYPDQIRPGETVYDRDGYPIDLGRGRGRQPEQGARGPSRSAMLYQDSGIDTQRGGYGRVDDRRGPMGRPTYSHV